MDAINILAKVPSIICTISSLCFTGLDQNYVLKILCKNRIVEKYSGISPKKYMYNNPKLLPVNNNSLWPLLAICMSL